MDYYCVHTELTLDLLFLFRPVDFRMASLKPRNQKPWTLDHKSAVACSLNYSSCSGRAGRRLLTATLSTLCILLATQLLGPFLFPHLLYSSHTPGLPVFWTHKPFWTESNECCVEFPKELNTNSLWKILLGCAQPAYFTRIQWLNLSCT